MFAKFAKLAVGGGAVPPPQPTISYGSLTNSGTQITATITNFTSEYTYVATSNVGSLSRSGANITVTGLPANTSINILVIATTAKGLSAPSSAITDRQPYTYRTETRTGTRFVDTTSCYIASSTEPRCPFGGTLNIAGTQCCIPAGYTETYTFTVEIKNDPPAGYLDSGFDWYRVGNVSIQRIPYTYTTYQENYTYPCPSTCCVNIPCSVPCPGTCSAPDTCYSLSTCTGGATYYDWGCGGTGCCVCPAGMGQSGCTCYYQCQIESPCTRYYPCTVQCSSTCQYCSPCTINCPGTRPVTVRNPTPSGYLDSGVDWYRFV